MIAIKSAYWLLLALPFAAPAAAASSPSTTLPTCPNAFGKLLQQSSVTIPATGAPHEVEVGNVILEASTLNTIDGGVKLPTEASFTGKRGGATFIVTIPQGDYGPSDWRGTPYPLPQASFRYEKEEKERRGLSRPDISLWVDDVNGNKLMASLNFGLSTSNFVVENAQFERQRCVRPATKALRREILYSGGAKGVISLLYREFLDDYARPAFSQELTFDLANGKEIGFRGARIRVEEISNTGIRYSVLRGLE